MTPEGKVKAKVRAILDRYDGMYTYWPVSAGPYGKPTVDLIGCYRGRFFAVETKADGKKPTLRQTLDLATMARAMGRTFVVAGTDSPVLKELVAWLDQLTGDINDDPHIPPDTVNRRAV